MAAQTTRLLLVFYVSLTVVFPRLDAANATVPAVFIFGDSTADVGTNNFLPSTKAKANYLPYGIDFVPPNATGRFSNGFNTADNLAMMMGFKSSPPPFFSLEPCSTDARIGANFASAGSGILESTGSIYGQYVSMGRQIQQFGTLRSNLTAQWGTNATDKLISSSVFLVSTGSNDFFEAYGATNGSLNSTQRSALIAGLTMTYQGHFKALYNLGARKLGIVGVPPIGCCPSWSRLNSSSGCLEDLNELALDFHQATDAMLRNMSSQLPRLKYAHGNAFEMVISFFDDPLAFGFTELRAACCGEGKLGGEIPCLPSSKFCGNRDQYLFWDLFHPTQAASKLAAETLFGGSTKFVSPINFGQLIEG